MKRKKTKTTKQWRVETYDTFEGRFYGGGIKYKNKKKDLNNSDILLMSLIGTSSATLYLFWLFCWQIISSIYLIIKLISYVEFISKRFEEKYLCYSCEKDKKIIKCFSKKDNKYCR